MCVSAGSAAAPSARSLMRLRVHNTNSLHMCFHNERTRVLSRPRAHKRAEEGGRQEGVDLTGWNGRWGGRLQKPCNEAFIFEATDDRARAEQREEERGRGQGL